MKNSFIFYTIYADKFHSLSDEQFGKLVRCMVKYEETGEIIRTGDVGVDLSFDVVKTDLDLNREKYENIVKRNQENGKKGGRPKNPSKPKKPSGLFGNPKNPDEPKKAEYDYDNDYVNDNDISNINNKYIDNNKVIEVDKVNSVKEKYKKEKRVYYPNDDELNKAFENFVAHRKLMKKPMGDEAINLNMKKLAKLSEGDNDKAIAILNQSIERGWQGLFELKDDYINTGSTIDSHQAYLDKWRNA